MSGTRTIQEEQRLMTRAGDTERLTGSSFGPSAWGALPGAALTDEVAADDVRAAISVFLARAG